VTEATRSYEPYVYFLQREDGAVKIGCSRRVALRRGEVERGEKTPCALLGMQAGDRQLEQELHRKFAAHALGHEWFAPAHLLLDYIDAETVRPWDLD
jgi:hypothetical protein